MTTQQQINRQWSQAAAWGAGPLFTRLEDGVCAVPGCGKDATEQHMDTGEEYCAVHCDEYLL